MPRLGKEPFEAMVREHHAAVFRSAMRLLGDAALAADVAQEVFVRVLEGKERLDVARSQRATLCWLAARLASNALRARRRRRGHEEDAMTGKHTSIDERSDPARTTADRDMDRVVRDLVEQLPHDLRLPLQMRCQDELSFAAIGTALHIPESTAHDRVQRALQRLRTALVGRGLAVAAGGLPQLIAMVDAAAPPADLQARLLALGGRATVGALGAGARLALGLAASVVVAGIAVLVTSRGGADAPVPLEAHVAPGERAPGPAPQDPPALGPRPERAPGTEVLLVQDDPAPAAKSTFRGTVHDAGAWPVGGAVVQAVAAGGLKPFALGEATTDAQGVFAVDVGPSDLRPSRVRLRVLESGRLLLETPELELPRDAAAPALALVLPPEVGTAMSRYDVTVAVSDRAGMPLAGVAVQILPDAGPRPMGGWAAPELAGTTGADGTLVLTGRTQGPKWVFADGRPSGRRTHFERLSIDRPGAHRVAVTLGAGLALSGRIGTVDGPAVDWANVNLEDEVTGLWHAGELQPDGAVAFTGLGEDSYTLHVSPPWELSPAIRRGLRAGSPPFSLLLKRRLDVRDVGDHMAELHGELVDAVTGEAVPFTGFCVDVRPLRRGASTLATDRIVPLGPVQQLETGGPQFRFDEVGLTAGSWGLIANVPGYATTVGEFDLRDGEIREGLRVALHRGGGLRGRVLGVDGGTAGRVHVFLVGVGGLADDCVEKWRARSDGDRDRTAPPSQLACSTWTGSDGTFVLRDVPPGVEVRVVARQEEGALAVLPARLVRSGEVQSVGDVRLAPP